MTATPVDIDRDVLMQATRLAGTTSDRETVNLALRTLIAVRRQPAVVERVIGRRFPPDQIDSPTVVQQRVALRDSVAKRSLSE